MAKYDGSLLFDTAIDDTGFKKGIGKLTETGKAAGKVVAGALVAITTALVGIGTYATKRSVEFESAFAGVRKTVDATAEEFKALEKGIMDMTKRLPSSADAIAGVMESAGQLGIKNENLLTFTETMVMLGDATNMSAEEASTSLARLANVTGMSQTDFNKLGSSIVDLGNNLATTEAEIVDMGLRLAGTGSQIGLSEHQILGLAGAMSSVGIRSEAGGSAFSRIMQKMNSEVLSNGELLSGFAKISGQSAEEFSKAWKDKPEQAIISFVDGLQAIKESGGDVATELKKLGITSVNEIDTLLRLSGAEGLLAESLGISAEAWEENTALINEANQRYETTESKIAILKNTVDGLAIKIGNELKSSLVGVIGEAMNMAERLSTAFEENGFDGLVEELGSVIADIVQMLADGAPKLFEMASSMLTSFISGIQTNLPKLIESALSMGLTFITTLMDLMPQILLMGVDIVIGLIQGVTEMIPVLAEKGTEMIMNLISGLQEQVPTLLESGMAMITSLVNAMMGMLPELVRMGAELLVSLVLGIAEMLPELIVMALDIIIMLADTIIENVPMIIDAGIQVLLSLIEGIISVLPTLVEEVPRIINSFASAIYSKLPDILVAGIKILMMLIKGLIDTIPTLIANIPQIIMAIVNAFTLFNWWNMGKGVITSIGSGISSMVGNIGTIAKNLALNVINGIKGIFTSAPSIGSGFIKGVISGISSMLSGIVSIASSLAGTVFNTIKSALAPSNMATIGKALVQGIWNGIDNVTGWILDKIKGFGASIVGGIKSIFGIKSPSTIMRDEIGENLTLGIGVGIEKGLPSLNKEIDSEMRDLTDRMKTSVDVESNQVGTRMAMNGGFKTYVPDATKSNANLGELKEINITGNTFVIREEADIKKVARELDRLRLEKERG